MKRHNLSAVITAEKVNSFRYLVTKFDANGWADATTALPIPFDLVTLLTDRNKEIGGWWALSHWEGLRLRPQDIVLKWKRRRYEFLNS